MSCEVYANGNEIACKAGDGKVIASFPDVCLSPPPPPTGPIPVPYPNTSFSKDMQNGSSTVKIKGKEVMLKDQSFYKTSPLGDEAATRNFGANVLSHVITGKTYFVAWSMDVKMEGLNVDRHIDLTTSNHASWPGGVSVPNPNLDAMAWAKLENETDTCACCGASPRHATGRAMTFSGWYGMSKRGPDGRLTAGAKARRAKMAQMVRDKEKRGCSCKVFPSEPCNVFRDIAIPGPEKSAIDAAWRNKKNQPGFVESLGVDTKDACVIKAGRPDLTIANRAAWQSNTALKTQRDTILTDMRKVDHLTPRAAGGCPVGTGNLTAHENGLCAGCKDIDAELTTWQGQRAQGLLT